MRLLLRPEHLRPIALAGDTLVAAGAWAVAARFTGTGETLPTWSAGVGIVLLLVLLDLLGLLQHGEPRARVDLVLRSSTAVVLAHVTLSALLFVANTEVPRHVVLVVVALQLLGIPAWRLALAAVWRPHTRRVVLVGDGATAVALAETILARRLHGLVVVGHVRAPGSSGPPEPHLALGPALGTVADLPGLVTSGVLDEIVLAVDEPTWKTGLLDTLAELHPRRPGLLLVPDPFESVVGRMRYRWIHDVPMVEVVRSNEWSIDRPVKRALDLVGASLLGLALVPVALFVAAAIRVSSPGPVLYRQQRVGRNRQPFELVKFRTMVVDAEADGAERLAERGDSRMTPIGSWLRRMRLDELPQLWNVLRGEMSLVGPRPERPGFVARYLAEVPGYGERFAVRPGLTGLAQVVGDYHTRVDNKLRYDLAYIANQSLVFDLAILVRTVRTVLSTSGT